MTPEDALRDYMNSLAEFEIADPELFVLAAADGSEFEIRLAAPAGCERALILLDGDLLGGIAVDTARSLAMGGEIAPVAIAAVGIGARTYGDVHADRAYRFTFDEIDLSMIGDVRTGGGDDFLAFLLDRLIPELERRLPALSAPPALAGYSLGGLFALGAIARSANAFGGYAAISPALWADNDATSAALLAYAPESPARVHLSVGELERGDDPISQRARMIGRVEDLAEAMAHDPSWDSEYCLIADSAHYSVAGPALVRALRFLFSA